MTETEKQFPVIETERLILRELTHDDANEVLSQYADPEVIKYITMDQTESQKDALEIIDWGKSILKGSLGVYWGIFTKDTGSHVGDINYFGKQDESFEGRIHRADIGYALKRKYWGKGYGSEALQAVIRYLFTATDIHRLEAIIQPVNTRSRKLAEKCGFQEEGTLRDYMCFRGEHLDYVMYSLLKREWQG